MEIESVESIDRLVDSVNEEVSKSVCMSEIKNCSEELRYRNDSITNHGNRTEDSDEFNEDCHGRVSKDLPSDLLTRTLCRRLLVRRNALCDPEKMPMTQDTRERIQRDVECRRKSLTRKLSQYLSVRLNLDKEEDLI